MTVTQTTTSSGGERQRKPSKVLVSSLAKNLRARRQALGLSQEELADACGLHRTYLGSIERCERNVTLSTLEVLANALRISIAELLMEPSDNDK